MKYIKLFLYYILQWTWALPQNLLGLFLFLKYRKNPRELIHGALLTYHYEEWGGVSLGMFIVINGGLSEEWTRCAKIHEYGHTIQSLILGPLYLLIIGIPSFLWCNTKWGIARHKKAKYLYYTFFPEKWANYLGERVTGLVITDKYPK
jgi:hypothetical protein